MLTHLQMYGCLAQAEEGGARVPAPEGSLSPDCSLDTGSQVLSVLPSLPCCLYLDAGLPLLPQLQKHSYRIGGLCTASDTNTITTLMLFRS